LFEKVYGFVNAHLAGASAPDRAAFNAAVALGTRVRASRERGEPISAQDTASYDEATAGFFRWYATLSAVGFARRLTGAAPIAPEILEFFFACGVPIYEAYGMTEATAVITANRPASSGSAPSASRLRAWTYEFPTTARSVSRSGGTFIGYWRNDKATAEMIVDRTGIAGVQPAVDDHLSGGLVVSPVSDEKCRPEREQISPSSEIRTSTPSIGWPTVPNRTTPGRFAVMTAVASVIPYAS